MKTRRCDVVPKKSSFLRGRRNLALEAEGFHHATWSGFLRNWVAPLGFIAVLTPPARDPDTRCGGGSAQTIKEHVAGPPARVCTAQAALNSVHWLAGCGRNPRLRRRFRHARQNKTRRRRAARHNPGSTPRVHPSVSHGLTLCKTNLLMGYRAPVPSIFFVPAMNGFH